MLMVIHQTMEIQKQNGYISPYEWVHGLNMGIEWYRIQLYFNLTTARMFYFL